MSDDVAARAAEHLASAMQARCTVDGCERRLHTADLCLLHEILRLYGEGEAA